MNEDDTYLLYERGDHYEPHKWRCSGTRKQPRYSEDPGEPMPTQVGWDVCEGCPDCATEEPHDARLMREEYEDRHPKEPKRTGA